MALPNDRLARDAFAPAEGARSRVRIIADLCGGIDGLFATTYALLSRSTVACGIVGTRARPAANLPTRRPERSVELADDVLRLMGLTGAVPTFAGGAPLASWMGRKFDVLGPLAIGLTLKGITCFVLGLWWSEEILWISYPAFTACWYFLYSFLFGLAAEVNPTRKLPTIKVAVYLACSAIAASVGGLVVQFGGYNATLFEEYKKRSAKVIAPLGVEFLSIDPAPRVVKGTWHPRMVVLQRWSDRETLDPLYFGGIRAARRAARHDLRDQYCGFQEGTRGSLVLAFTMCGRRVPVPVQESEGRVRLHRRYAHRGEQAGWARPVA